MTLVDLLIWLAVIAVIVVAAWYIFSQLPLPDPIRKILIIVAVAVVAILAVAFLLQMRGGHFAISDIDPQHSVRMLA